MRRFVVGAAWFLLFWLGSFILVGNVISMKVAREVPADQVISASAEAGREFGARWGGLINLGALSAAVAGTALGTLPGTKKKEVSAGVEASPEGVYHSRTGPLFAMCALSGLGSSLYVAASRSAAGCSLATTLVIAGVGFICALAFSAVAMRWLRDRFPVRVGPDGLCSYSAWGRRHELA